MAYDAALNTAWEDLAGIADRDIYSIIFFGGSYEIDVKKRKVRSLGDKPLKIFIAILLLHYLIGSLKAKYEPSGEWVLFDGRYSRIFAVCSASYTPSIKSLDLKGLYH